MVANGDGECSFWMGGQAGLCVCKERVGEASHLNV